MFRGIYHGKAVHPSDLVEVLRRAYRAGVQNIMITASSLSETLEAIQLIEEHRDTPDIPRLCTTLGVHPCQVQKEFVDVDVEQRELLKRRMLDAASMPHPLIHAIGEFGLGTSLLCIHFHYQ